MPASESEGLTRRNRPQVGRLLQGRFGVRHHFVATTIQEVR